MAKYLPIKPCKSGYSLTKSEHKSDLDIDAAISAFSLFKLTHQLTSHLVSLVFAFYQR